MMWRHGLVYKSGSPPGGPLVLAVGQPPQQQQQQNQPVGLPFLTEERFMDFFMLFSYATGVRLNEQDFIIEGRPVNPWLLHRAVFARNGFDSVTANDEWPMIGACPGQLAHCAPAVAHRLQQIYQVSLRHFDQAYINSVGARSGSLHASSQVHAQSHQQTQTDCRPLSASIASESMLPLFSSGSCTQLEAQRVSEQLGLLESNKEHLKCASQDQSGLTGLNSTSLLAFKQSVIHSCDLHKVSSSSTRAEISCA
ncbi:hypothetical protein F5148DRAFT_1213912 [Russula earlei]|uniref:Uncharacterized protein n=1 Tax=Russula earlei TaxID=71964 RepID=A0ACC0U533_9AGAM|nr:hypothetical protein F5148DRAFT_1213912 [Russula earlei]